VSRPVVRDSVEADLDQIATIYTHHVTFALGSFEEAPPRREELARRRADVLGRGLPFLIARCTATGARQMVAVIGDSQNSGSIGLHAALGFRRVGTLEAIGWKHGRWVDSVLMQRSLGPGGSSPPG
jgi:L-amino acid N-acyltransferase YncA